MSRCCALTVSGLGLFTGLVAMDEPLGRVPVRVACQQGRYRCKCARKMPSVYCC